MLKVFQSSKAEVQNWSDIYLPAVDLVTKPEDSKKISFSQILPTFENDLSSKLCCPCVDRPWMSSCDLSLMMVFLVAEGNALLVFPMHFIGGFWNIYTKSELTMTFEDKECLISDAVYIFYIRINSCWTLVRFSNSLPGTLSRLCQWISSTRSWKICIRLGCCEFVQTLRQKQISDLRITLKIFELLKTSTCLINIPELYVFNLNFKIGFGSFLTAPARRQASQSEVTKSYFWESLDSLNWCSLQVRT